MRARPSGPQIVSAALLAVAAASAVVIVAHPPAIALWVVATSLVALPSIAIGTLLSLRRGDLWMGPLLVALGTMPLLTAAAESWGSTAAGPAPLPGAEAAAALGAVSWTLWWLAPVLIGMTFPDGTPVGPAWRWALWLPPAAVVLTTLGLMLDPASGVQHPLAPDVAAALSPVLGMVGLALLAASLLTTVASVVVRHRRGDAVARLQLRWLALGVGTLPVGLGVGWLVGLSDPRADGTLGLLLIAFGFGAIAAAVWIAVTRHGLYAIGRVISRALAWAIVTAVAVGVYAATVTSVSWLLPALPAAAVAVATLVAAAAFLPALRLVQRAVDRRFDRERYDAQQVVERFGERLRTEPDPSTTADALLRAAERALQPASIGLWLPGDGRGPADPIASGR